MKKGGFGPNVCGYCLKEEEIVNHLLVSCSFTI